MMTIINNVIYPASYIVGAKWTVIDWFLSSSCMNWSTTIGRCYGDRRKRHDSFAMSAIGMSFGDVGSDMAATLPHHQ